MVETQEAAKFKGKTRRNGKTTTMPQETVSYHTVLPLDEFFVPRPSHGTRKRAHNLHSGGTGYQPAINLTASVDAHLKSQPPDSECFSPLSQARIKAISEIVSELVRGVRDGEDVDLNEIKKEVQSRSPPLHPCPLLCTGTH